MNHLPTEDTSVEEPIPEENEDDDLALALAMSLGVDPSKSSEGKKPKESKETEPVLQPSDTVSQMLTQLRGVMITSFDVLVESDDSEDLNKDVCNGLAKYCRENEEKREQTLSFLQEKIRVAHNRYDLVILPS